MLHVFLIIENMEMQNSYWCNSFHQVWHLTILKCYLVHTSCTCTIGLPICKVETCFTFYKPVFLFIPQNGFNFMITTPGTRRWTGALLNQAWKISVYKVWQEFIMHEGKSVSNVLYTLWNKSSESNVTSCLAHMTEPRSQTLPTMKNRCIFRYFCDGFYSNARSVSCFLGIFAQYGALVSLHSKPRL